MDHTAALGGAELSLRDIIAAFREQSTTLLFSDGPLRSSLEALGARVRVLEVRPALLNVRRETQTPRADALWAVLQTARVVAREARRHDLVYASSQKAFVVGAIAAKLARRPLLWHLHDLMSEEHFSRTNLRLAILLANHSAARVITNSEASLRAFHRAGGDTRRAGLVYYGFDPSPYAAGSPGEEARLRAQAAPGEGLLVGVFSRLAPWKGQDVLIDALPRLPGVRALLVGEALFAEGDYADGLRRRVETLGLADRVHFAGFRSDVPRLMRAVDVVAHTSRAAEPFGRVIVEGMLAARPVVATDAGGAREILGEDNRFGLLVPPGDPPALAAAIERLAASPDLRHTLGLAARAEASERFTLGAMLRGIDAEIRQALAA